MAAADRPDHDSLYHRLFSYPGVVAQLLRGFVAGPWLDDLDFDRMERLNAKLHAETGQYRESDMIWRIPHRTGGDRYLVLLLEFQSTSDQFMALRALNYAALLWQHLVREGRLQAGRKLPPLLPVVIYNGDRPWTSPVAVRDLIGLPQDAALWRWQPDVRYWLIDAGAFSDADLQALDSIPALWFRLEIADDPAQVVAVAAAVLGWLSRHPDYAALRAVFAEFLAQMAPPPSADIPIKEEWLDMQSRLLARAEQWTQAWLQEGRQQGLQEGRQEGEAALLLRMLERRFGPVPEKVSERIRAADSIALEEWGLRLLDAGSIEDVIGETPA